MTYHQDRKEATRLVDKLLKEGETEAEITNKIQLRYGFGASFIRKRILLLEEIGSITIKKGKIKFH